MHQAKLEHCAGRIFRCRAGPGQKNNFPGRAGPEKNGPRAEFRAGPRLQLTKINKKPLKFAKKIYNSKPKSSKSAPGRRE